MFDPCPATILPRRATLSLRLQGVAMILVLLLGAAAGARALGGGRGRQRVAKTASIAAFLDGRLAGAVNDVMAHNLPGDPVLRAAGGVLRWVLFRSGGPQVSPGCGNWLFLTEELRPWPEAQHNMVLRAEAMRRIVDGGRRRGVAVVFAVVPDKARVEAAARCGARYSAQSEARYAGFVGLARARGLAVVDLLQVFGTAAEPGALYYRTDTHWSQRGAALAAAAILAGVPAGLVKRDGVFHTATRAVAVRPGDLLRLMSLEHVDDGFGLRPLPDWEGPETTTEAPGADDGGGLLDAVPPPQVILLGSSFSLNGNCLGRLEQDMGTSVGQFATAGGGFWGSAHGYFTNAAWRDTPPRLIVWEIPERVVGQPATDDELAFMEAGDPTGLPR